MAKTPPRLKHTSPIFTGSPERPFLVEVSMIVGQALPPKSSEVVSDFGSHPISSTRLPCSAIMWLRLASVKLLPIPPLP
jgi:hypothetical protein